MQGKEAFLKHIFHYLFNYFQKYGTSQKDLMFFIIK